MEIPNTYKKNLYVALLVFLIILSVYYAARALSEFKSYGVIGDKETSTITLSGHGEVNAVPDIANISFTISKDSKTAKDAQSQVAEIEKKALDLLKADKIADKDIKTTDASFYPKYEYKYPSELCNQYGCPPAGRSVVVGYTSSESINVKVRNTDDAGKIIEELSALDISNLSGPDFSIDNQDGVKAEARKKAIDDAKTKATALAKDLGVHLGKITSFNESSVNYPVPMYAKDMTSERAIGAAAPAQLPKGENTVSSDISITYEIK